MKLKINKIFCKGDEYKVIVVCIASLIIGLFTASLLETKKLRPIPTMSDIANKHTTNLVLHLPIVRIGSGIR